MGECLHPSLTAETEQRRGRLTTGIPRDHLLHASRGGLVWKTVDPADEQKFPAPASPRLLESLGVGMGGR